jgi:hypothetical protein
MMLPASSLPNSTSLNASTRPNMMVSDDTELHEAVPALVRAERSV